MRINRKSFMVAGAFFIGMLSSGISHGIAAEGWRLVDFSIESELVPSPIEISALLPPSYETANGPFPLLLQLHGGFASNEFLARRKKLIESVWTDGKLPELVVVTPSTGRSFYMDYKDGSQRWETFIMQELLPALRRKFKVVQDRDGTLLAGVSMGGMGSLRLAFKYPDRFAAVAALEPAIEPVLAFEEIEPSDRAHRSDGIYEEIFGNPVDVEYWQANHPPFIASTKLAQLKESGLQVYLECGDEDRFNLFRGAEFLHRILYDGGVKHEYRLVRGADHFGPSRPGRYINALEFLGRVLNPMK